MGPTEQTIFEQFSFWRQAIAQPGRLRDAEITVFVGCGTSYNLAAALASLANTAGVAAIAVPGGEWTYRPANYWPRWQNAHVVALSRSGETTETIAAAKASRAAGAFVTGITMEAESALAQNCDALVLARTHPAEGIVMTTSASLMLLLGTQLMGYPIDPALPDKAERLLAEVEAQASQLITGRRLFVYLGGGALYGIGLEGALKLTEMSQVATQAFHPLEYRHGPVSLVDGETAAVMLYSHDQREAEEKLVRELQAKGAFVIGLGGPGNASFAVDVAPELRGLAMLPALQLLGERTAQSHDIDTAAPRHLTKVVTLA